ncbi:Excinuclease ABC subunit C [hydrothermal vent metagenome]|uniref:Excinuclease ABC subunit C n=1 Tax=hydrothermal vent metagenome TaxID=652676 RepID=A0A3B1DPL5_9ZZZZ
MCVPDDPIPQSTDAKGFAPAETPPAWGSETRDERLSRLRERARSLPRKPGVYLLKDAKGVVLYVGKAGRLNNRVSSYFVPSADLGAKKQPMLDVVHDFEVLVCESEWEALLAENRLIKDIKPRFNASMMDDRSYPFLVVTQREDFPRVFVTRNPEGRRADGTISSEMKGARVFGPFVNAGALREAVQVLQLVFKFRTCTLDIIAGDPKNRFFRPCLLYAINQCSGPCADKIGKEAYRDDADRFVRFLSSKRSVMLREMRDEMQQAAKELRFETAAALRDQIRAIEKLDERPARSKDWRPETDIGYIDPAKSLRSLQKTLGMERPIRCIEGIDIAHLQGGETVGSKVCFVDGKPFKNEYRRYRIRSVEGGNDDYGSIREVVSRRYREAGDGQELYPDVILIDGGLGQLHAALEAFEQLDIRPPMVISLAKKEELIYIQERGEPICLSRNNAGLRLCQAIRDEAHRFAQHYHHVLRRKKTLDEE